VSNCSEVLCSTKHTAVKRECFHLRVG
jgi:hypothetical protein